MPSLRSPNPQTGEVNGTTPSRDPNYIHPAETRSPNGIPMMFQVTSPFDRKTVLLPHALVLHVNPASFEETHIQKKESIQTRGGFVEQHWGHELVEISASGSTGSFMNIHSGLSSLTRQRSIAWDRYRDLVELYHNNGSVNDPYGNVVLQGHIMIMYDRGTYLGTFRSFETTETADAPFAFQISWSFKVDRPILRIPISTRNAVAGAALSTQKPIATPDFQRIQGAPITDARREALRRLNAESAAQQDDVNVLIRADAQAKASET